ncbi:MAG: hypothetical protein WD232_01170 [Acidimicrobiales bacterium]
MGLISRLAASADVPVFPVVGIGGRTAARSLATLGGIRVVDHPRAAVLMLLVGRPTRSLLRPLLAVHDQLSGPRCTVWWRTGRDGGDELVAALPAVEVLPVGDASALRRVFTELVNGARASDPPALDDIETTPWRGVGPYGQGGSGMTGGTPYGRPLVGRAPDPDGLQLDQLPLQVGPFFGPFPPGLVLHLEVQGDVVRHASLGENPFTRWPGDAPLGPLESGVFFDAVAEVAPVAGLELARARHHLRWASDALRLHGLCSPARRLAALAERIAPGDAELVVRIARQLGRSRSLASVMRGVGVVDPERHGLRQGIVARSTGVPEDARLSDPAYRPLGFEPIVHEGGDAWARFRQRLDEAAQALILAERAGERIRAPGPAVEGPRGALAAGAPSPSGQLLGILPELLVDQEWGDALTIVTSLDLDVEEAAHEVPAEASA